MSALAYNPKMSSAERIGKQIQLLRNRCGFSQDVLASRAGVSKTTLQNIEWGSANPTIDTLEAISQSLGVPFVELFDGPDGIRMPADAIWAKGAFQTLKQEIESSMNRIIASVPPLDTKRPIHGAKAIRHLDQSDDEKELLLGFRSLSHNEQRGLLSYLRSRIATSQGDKSTVKVQKKGN